MANFKELFEESGFAIVPDLMAENEILDLRKERWSQGVDATLACSLSAGVSNPNVFRGR